MRAQAAPDASRRRDEKVGIVGAAIVDFIVDNDLVLSLLQLDRLAELVGLGRLTLADDLRRRLEQAEKLPFDMCVAAKDARPCLFHHLLHPRRHFLDLLTQAFQGELLDDAARPFHPLGDLPDEPLRLANHPAGRSKQPAVAPLQPFLALRSLGARRSGNVEHAQFDAPAVVAEFRADVADDRGDLLHRPRKNPNAVAEQARIGRIVDIGLHHRGVDAHPPADRNPFRLRHFHEPFVHLIDGLRPDRQSPTADRLGVRHPAAADADEVAVDQVGAHFALENLVAPVAHVLENEQTQDHVGPRAQPAATAAFRMAAPSAS